MAGKIWRWLKGAEPKPIDVLVHTRADCPLCDHAIAMLYKLQKDYPLRIELRDVDAEPELVRLHGERVPVVVINGRERAWGQVNEALLVRTLRGMGKEN